MPLAFAPVSAGPEEIGTLGEAASLLASPLSQSMTRHRCTRWICRRALRGLIYREVSCVP